MRQIQCSQSNFIEKVMRDGNGRLVRATFCVYEVAGRLKARLVDYVYIGEISGSKQATAIAGRICENTYSELVSYFNDFVSPYFDLNNLYLSGSKPRAPTK